MSHLTSLWRSGALALSLALPAAALAQTPPADKVMARVNGAPVTVGDLAVAADDPALSLPGVGEDQKQTLLLDYMIDLKLGAQAAEKAKVADSPDFARKLAYFRDKLLLDEYLEREAKKAVTPEAARKLYDETVKAMKPEEEVHARHILVESEAEAKKIAARLKGGEDFAKIAAEASKDPGSKAEGGDLGWFTRDRMVAPFADAAFKLDAGKLSDPVKTQFGWHVIKVEEKRTKPVPSFEEMREQVDAYLTRKTQQEVITRLRDQAKVEKTEAAAPAKPADAAPAEPKKP
ncbi:MAG: peptidylprolyl isomerase [Methylobacterium frigidaeris]